VTTVDSGSKALELLGLRDNDAEDASSPSSSSPDQQVKENGSLAFASCLLHPLPSRIGRHPVLYQPLFLFLLQEIDVNLIITDYCMPGMTGYDLLKRVKVRGLQLNSLPLFGRSLIILMVHEPPRSKNLIFACQFWDAGVLLAQGHSCGDHVV